VSAGGRLVWSLAWRFVRGRRTRLLAGTTWAALLATALGVAAMVIAMALMTGYRHDLQAKLVQGSAAIVAYPLGRLDDATLDGHVDRVEAIEGVTSAQRVVYGEGSLATAARPDGADVLLRGIDRLEGLEEVCALELLPAASGPPGGALRLVVGKELHRELEIAGGETVRLMVLGFAGGRPRFHYRGAVVDGLCDTGFSEFDRQWVLLDRQALQAILGVGGGAAGTGGAVIEVRVASLARTTDVAAGVKAALGPDFLISDYYDLNRELFTALRLQQVMLFLVLGLIVFVSTFNTASSLVVMVRERRRDLGVLSALGLAPEQHRGVFLRYGLLLGVLGTTIGLALGSTAAWAMDELELLRFDPEVAAIYFLSAVPFRLVPRDLAAVALFTLSVTLLACWLPARRAGRIAPAEALRYE
jgi:lipoprotein-releasing system permease protein